LAADILFFVTFTKMTVVSAHLCVAAVILLIGQVVLTSCYMPDMKDDCFVLCGITPNSVKCFRCKNRLPMRFGKRGEPLFADVLAAETGMQGRPDSLSSYPMASDELPADRPWDSTSWMDDLNERNRPNFA
jgi:hypothetical protein